MTPVKFEQSNGTHGPPPELSDSQCATIHTYRGTIKGGSCDGAPLVITAWKPNEEELAKLNAGAPVFLSCIGGLPPHCLTADFESATLTT